MVVDCGGGTVDITIHEVERADERCPRVKEVAPASGGAWGSTSIDRCVFKLFEDVFGRNRYNQMMKDSLGHIQLQDDVERAKCSFNGEINPVIQLPDSLLNSTKNDLDTPNQAVSNYNRINQARLQLKVSDEDEFPQFSDHYSVKVIGIHSINIPMKGTGRITTGMLFGNTELRCKSVNELGEEVETALVLT
ncbi:hypothetical protein BC938DRAFT_475118 [Jimgerdemannia flammicorona]|uniref:Actin-like ATPase domain-containing protein n=1 Tax=Jimgerdemannia flammicorona TaxID=994334 RepID=A0A433QRX4_9FUNG|nr:hypothetical protein BC938DRAFT_475118 [Jimgerdemannia flammicorona]